MTRVYPINSRMPDQRGHKGPSIPLMSAVVRLDDFLVIIDTGYPGPERFTKLLAQYGFRPPDFGMVINTHVHPDHTGNNRLFADARIVVSRTDYFFAREYSHELLATTDPEAVLAKYYPEFPPNRRRKFAPYARDLAVKYWSDDHIGPAVRIQWIEDGPELPGQITLWHTPGHTPGHYSVEIRDRDFAMLVTGDALPSRLFWKSKLRELVPRHNDAQFRVSKEKIEAFEGFILGGHDEVFSTADGRYVKGEVIEGG
ncbi:MBL fold metallo-hydrolase [candidate division KSB1 bacterium]|nr:MBL fold metallo-hydrolase [candidate division KSB1 bacterium]